MRCAAAVLALLCALSFAPHRAAAKKRGRAPREVPELTKDGLPNIQSQSALVWDLDAGAELYSKNPTEVRAIASVGKLFLALVLLDRKLDLDGVTKITEEDARLSVGGARSRLTVGKSFQNIDLLRAMLISSDNRACTALGRAVGLSPPELVGALNRKARSLGLGRTRFVDATGLGANVSTAREVLTGLMAALAIPLLADILTTKQVTIQSTDGRVTIDYVSTDVALRAGRYTVLGGKTGFTDDAKYCLAIAARVGDRRVGMVFLGADGKLTRFGDFNRTASWLLAGGGAKKTAAR
ncbi:MAG TPA: serine hydrolase [Haliangiales bacterium]|nr:serine hydrolase [Haliangiales bacterium]